MDFTTSTTTHTSHTDAPTRPTNGSIKRHLPVAAPPPTATTPMVVSSAYKECLKNHAASIGGHALDGCGEFMPSATAAPTDPRSLKCAACGCHRNFHRREPQPEPPNLLARFYSPPPPTQALRGLSTSTSTSPSPSRSQSPMSSPSPPPLSHFPPSSYHSLGVVPHMLLALGTGFSGPSDEQHRGFNSTAAKVERENPSGKKRCRTKFSPEQKEKMRLFSEKLGWKMHKGDDRSVQEFCDEIGVSRRVFKVWMHNNKNTFRLKRSETAGDVNAGNDHKVNGNDDHNNNDNDNVINGGGFHSDINKNPFIDNEGECVDLHANGSSSS